MNLIRVSTLFIILIFSISCSTSSRKSGSQISMKDFFKNPTVQSLRLSPDGQYIASLRPYKKRMNIFIQKVGSDKLTRLTQVTDRDINGIGWKGNSHILFSRDFGGDENFHVFSVNINNKNQRDLTPFKGVKAHLIDKLEGIDEQHILVSTNQRDRKIYDAYKLNVETGKSQLVAKNPGNFSGWVTDRTGQIRMATATDGVNTSVYYRSNSKNKFKKIFTSNYKQKFSPLLFAKNNKYVYMLSNLKRDKMAVVLYDPSRKKELKTIFKRDDVDVSGLDYSRKSGDLISASYTTWKRQKHFLDKRYKAINKDLQTKLPNKEIILTSNNKSEDLFTIYAGSDVSRGVYYTYNSQTKSLKHFADLSPWLPEKQLSPMKPIKYKSRDGLTIHGYLTLPRGSKKTNLPIVVNPHGGPWHRDTWGFNPEVQFLANRGYAVLQMNFRGSTGYGKKFWSSSFKQWGLKMQDDVTDGVQWLINNKIADKDRVCIYGASYGGYATLAGLTFTPDLYKCGIDYVGVSNLFTFIKTIPPYWNHYLAMLHDMVGHPIKDKELLTKTSPVFHVDKIKAALFVAQGAKDPRVKIDESDQVVAALKKRGVNIKYMVKENEGHGFRNEENRFEFYKEMESFLDTHLN